MKVPLPCRRQTRPSTSSSSSAWRIVLRPTPNRAARSRSVGRRLAGVATHLR